MARGLTHAELARRVGTARPNIAAYESGAKSPSPDTVRRLVAALRPTPSAALAGHEDEVLAIVRRHGGIEARVFGSVAKHRDTPDSDLDLLVDLGPGVTFGDLIAMEDELSALLGVDVEVASSRTATEEIERTAVTLDELTR